eukprot:SAG31_NODE_916_length_11047_cov_3.507033_9_plen_46_part_00
MLDSSQAPVLSYNLDLPLTVYRKWITTKGVESIRHIVELLQLFFR